MDDAFGMGVGQRLANLFENGQQTRQVVIRWRFRLVLLPCSPVLLFPCSPALLQQFGQRLAPDLLHTEEGPAICQYADLMDGRHTRVLQAAHDLGLF